MKGMLALFKDRSVFPSPFKKNMFLILCVLFSLGIDAIVLVLVVPALLSAYYPQFLFAVLQFCLFSQGVCLIGMCAGVCAFFREMRHDRGLRVRVSATQVASKTMPLVVVKSEGNREPAQEHPLSPKVMAAAERDGLTKREREVLGLLLQGRNAERVSEMLFISKHTAKSHMYNIYRKTGTSSHQELIDLFQEHLFE